MAPATGDELYDCMIVYCKEDLKIADEIIYILNSNGIRATLFDTNADFDHIVDREHRIGRIVERSVLYLSYIPDSGIHSYSDIHYLHSSITQSLTDPLKTWCFVPIWCKPKVQYRYQIPFNLMPYAETLIYSPSCNPERFIQALKYKIQHQDTVKKRAQLQANIVTAKPRQLDERPSEARQFVNDPRLFTASTANIEVNLTFPQAREDEPSFIPPLPDRQSPTTDRVAGIQASPDSMDTANVTEPRESTESRPIAVDEPMLLASSSHGEPFDELDRNLSTSQIAAFRGDDWT